MWRVSTLLMIFSLAMASIQDAPAQEVRKDVWAQFLGKRPPTIIVATPATGALARETPFNPATYGKVRGTAPAFAAAGPCIAVFTNRLGPENLELLALLDRITKETPAFGDGLIHVFDAKGAQQGGYTADEVQTRIRELQQVADKAKLTHSSFAIAASPGAAAQVGLDDSFDTAIVVLNVPPGLAIKPPVVAWYRVARAKELDTETLAEIERAIRESLTY